MIKNKRIISIFGLVSFAILTSGCSKITGGSWDYSEQRDETKNITIFKAERQFTEKDDKTALTKVALVCERGGNTGNGVNLNFSLVSLKDNESNKDKYDGVKFDETPSFRFASQASERMFYTDFNSSKYDNEIFVSFYSLIMSNDMLTALKGFITLSVQTEMINKSISSLAPNDNSNSEFQNSAALLGDAQTDAISLGTRNFKFPAEPISISYVAEGGSKRSISFSFDDPKLLKVAEACGWSKSPPLYKQKTSLFNVDGSLKVPNLDQGAATAPPAADAVAAPAAPSAQAAPPEDTAAGDGNIPQN